MDSYAPLLEKIRVPQPSLQKLAVISIFTKLRSAPEYLDSESGPGREAIAQCLQSTSPAVVDQSVRELCRLVTDSHMEISRGLLELQSALDGSDAKFVDLFVKGVGFMVRFGFQKNTGSWKLSLTETHPLVKVRKINDFKNAFRLVELEFSLPQRFIWTSIFTLELDSRPFINAKYKLRPSLLVQIQYNETTTVVLWTIWVLVTPIS